MRLVLFQMSGKEDNERTLDIIFDMYRDTIIYNLKKCSDFFIVNFKAQDLER